MYERLYGEGTSITAIPGHNPQFPNGSYAVTVTSYYNAQTEVQDNWGYKTTVPVTISPKVVYGYNGSMQ